MLTSSARLLQVLALLSCLGLSQAEELDEVILHGGVTLRGSITKEDERLIHIRTTKGDEQIIDRKLVERISYADGLDWAIVERMLDEGQWSRAAKFLQNAITDRPKSMRLRHYRRLTHCYLHLGQHQQAVNALSTGLVRCANARHLLIREHMFPLQASWLDEWDKSLAQQADKAPDPIARQLLKLLLKERYLATGKLDKADALDTDTGSSDRELRTLRHLQQNWRSIITTDDPRTLASISQRLDNLTAAERESWPVRWRFVKAMAAAKAQDVDQASLHYLRIALSANLPPDPRAIALHEAAQLLLNVGRKDEATILLTRLRQEFRDHPLAAKALQALVAMEQ